MTKLLSVTDLFASYAQGAEKIEVLKGASFEIKAGERVAIIGRSGSGKSTLLHIIAGLLPADSGCIMVQDVNIGEASQEELAALRSRSMGFVYQHHHLLGEFSALENVVIPLRIAGMSKREAEAAAGSYLERVDMAHRAKHFPSELSGGERQRIAVARAMVTQPKLICADEPTGNLDAENAAQVMGLIESIAIEDDAAVIVVTHDSTMLSAFDRVFELIDGHLIEARGALVG